jgi:hypothetical protein
LDNVTVTRLEPLRRTVVLAAPIFFLPRNTSMIAVPFGASALKFTRMWKRPCRTSGLPEARIRASGPLGRGVGTIGAGVTTGGGGAGGDATLTRTFATAVSTPLVLAVRRATYEPAAA